MDLFSSKCATSFYNARRKKTMRNSDIAQHNASFTATHGRTGYLFAPHVLRHTKAFRLLETGINVFYIRNLLRR